MTRCGQCRGFGIRYVLLYVATTCGTVWDIFSFRLLKKCVADMSVPLDFQFEQSIQEIDSHIRMESVRQGAARLKFEDFYGAIKRNLMEKKMMYDPETRKEIIDTLKHMKHRFPAEEKASLEEKLEMLGAGLECTVEHSESSALIYNDNVKIIVEFHASEVFKVSIGYFGGECLKSKEGEELLCRGEWSQFKDAIDAMVKRIPASLPVEERRRWWRELCAWEAELHALTNIEHATFEQINEATCGVSVGGHLLRPTRWFLVAEHTLIMQKLPRSTFQFSADGKDMPYIEWSVQYIEDTKERGACGMVMVQSAHSLLSSHSLRRLSRVLVAPVDGEKCNAIAACIGTACIERDVSRAVSVRGTPLVLSFAAHTMCDKRDALTSTLSVRDRTHWKEVVRVIREQSVWNAALFSVAALSTAEGKGWAESVKVHVDAHSNAFSATFTCAHELFTLSISCGDWWNEWKVSLRAVTSAWEKESVNGRLSRLFSKTWSLPLVLADALHLLSSSPPSSSPPSSHCTLTTSEGKVTSSWPPLTLPFLPPPINHTFNVQLPKGSCLLLRIFRKARKRDELIPASQSNERENKAERSVKEEEVFYAPTPYDFSDGSSPGYSPGASRKTWRSRGKRDKPSGGMLSPEVKRSKRSVVGVSATGGKSTPPTMSRVAQGPMGGSRKTSSAPSPLTLQRLSSWEETATPETVNAHVSEDESDGECDPPPYSGRPKVLPPPSPTPPPPVVPVLPSPATTTPSSLSTPITSSLAPPKKKIVNDLFDTGMDASPPPSQPTEEISEQVKEDVGPPVFPQSSITFAQQLEKKADSPRKLEDEKKKMKIDKLKIPSGTTALKDTKKIEKRRRSVEKEKGDRVKTKEGSKEQKGSEGGTRKRRLESSEKSAKGAAAGDAAAKKAKGSAAAAPLIGGELPSAPFIPPSGVLKNYRIPKNKSSEVATSPASAPSTSSLKPVPAPSATGKVPLLPAPPSSASKPPTLPPPSPGGGSVRPPHGMSKPAPPPRHHPQGGSGSAPPRHAHRPPPHMHQPPLAHPRFPAPHEHHRKTSSSHEHRRAAAPSTSGWGAGGGREGREPRVPPLPHPSPTAPLPPSLPSPHLRAPNWRPSPTVAEPPPILVAQAVVEDSPASPDPEGLQIVDD